MRRCVLYKTFQVSKKPKKEKKMEFLQKKQNFFTRVVLFLFSTLVRTWLGLVCNIFQREVWADKDRRQASQIRNKNEAQKMGHLDRFGLLWASIYFYWTFSLYKCTKLLFRFFVQDFGISLMIYGKLARLFFPK